jgi:hypothetical protein
MNWPSVCFPRHEAEYFGWVDVENTSHLRSWRSDTLGLGLSKHARLVYRGKVANFAVSRFSTQSASELGFCPQNRPISLYRGKVANISAHFSTQERTFIDGARRASIAAANCRRTEQFCNQCGAVVASEPAEYKQATVLFADKAHSMDIVAAAGTERLHELMTELVIPLVGGVVHRHGGAGQVHRRGPRAGNGVCASRGASDPVPACRLIATTASCAGARRRS